MPWAQIEAIVKLNTEQFFSALQTNFSASAEELKITHENFRMQVMVKHLKPHRLSPCAPTGTKRGSIDHMLQFASKIFLDV